MHNAIDSSSLYDIEGPLALSNSVHIYYGIAVIAVLSLLLIAYRWYRKNKHKPKAAPILPPYERALNNLSHLSIHAEGPVFASELEKILKAFIEAKVEKTIMHSTTEECLSVLRPLYLNIELFQNLSESLKYYDLVKFAKMPLPEESRYTCIEKAKSLIEGIQSQNYSLHSHSSLK